MSYTVEFGRLCNQVIRNTCVSILAKKYDLYVNYSSHDRITRLGIPLFCGSKRHVSTLVLDPCPF